MTGDIHALSGAYAVDALDGDERGGFERHLAECAECRSEVDSLREAAALMAETTAVEPPAALRGRVLAGIASVRPLPPETAGSQVATVTRLAPRRRRVASFLAAAAAVVAIGGGGAVAWQQLGDHGPQSTVSEVQAASDVEHFSVPVGNGGSATVYRSKKLDKAYIKTHAMPAAPAGSEYVLWLKHGDTMTQAGVMPAGSDNEVLLSGDAASADGAAVSVEDAGTSHTRPSDDIVASFSFDA